MKKSILIFAISKNPWIGGIYYRKNIIFSLLLNEKINEAYNIVVLTTRKYEPVFRDFETKIKIVAVNNKVSQVKAILQVVYCKIKYHAKYIFPIKNYKFFLWLGLQPISWIADFQHNYYPEFFQKKELDNRNENFKEMAFGDNPLILSSLNAKADLNKYYNSSRKNVYVIPFVSYIEKEINHITLDFEKQIMNKYNLQPDKYFCISNQFWQHKNHIVVFKAIERLIMSGQADNLYFVFTGELSDRRNSDYIDSLLNYVNNDIIKERINVVGLIDRDEQLTIMKNAKAIIQPSLFEGWGTVLEDAKVLDKQVLLSDIPVHREQKNEKCLLFPPNNDIELSKLILNVSRVESISDTNSGVANMYKSAFEYAKTFEHILLK